MTSPSLFLLFPLLNSLMSVNEEALKSTAVYNLYNNNNNSNNTSPQDLGHTYMHRK